MKEILEKLRIIDHLTCTLPIRKSEFIDRLSAVTEIGNTGIFSGAFDAFSSSKKEFRGQVNYGGFRLKRRRRFFDSSVGMGVASGTMTEYNGQLTIEAEINGFSYFFIFFYILLTIMYSGAIIGIFHTGGKGVSFLLTILLLHGAFMFSIPYFITRRSVKRLKYELEREFFYLTKK